MAEYSTPEDLRRAIATINEPGIGPPGMYEAAKRFCQERIPGFRQLVDLDRKAHAMRYAYVVDPEVEAQGGWIAKKYKMTIRGIASAERPIFVVGFASIHFGENLSGHFGGWIGDVTIKGQQVSYRYTQPGGSSPEEHAAMVAQSLLDISNGMKPTFR